MASKIEEGLIQMEKDVQEIKIQVELVKKDIENFQKVVDKLDTTNDKIQDLITNIQRITSLHEQKLTESEKNSEYIWRDLKSLGERVDKLEKYKWLLVGGFSLITLLIQVLSSIGNISFGK